MRRNAAREREQMNRISPPDSVDVVIANPVTPPSPPKLLETVIRALPEESAAVQLLTRGSKRRRKSHRGKVKPIEIETKLEVLSIDNEELSLPPQSPDLLAAIQMVLDKQNQFSNLTDSEKASIIGSQPEGNEQCFEREADAIKDTRMSLPSPDKDDDVDAFSRNA